MNKDLRWKFATILVVLGISLWFAIPWKRPFPKDSKMHLGLDLQGGTEIIYKLALEKLTPEKRKEIDPAKAANTIINIIESRINTHGLKEFKLRKHGDDKILIQLPGSDEEETKNVMKLIETSGKLEFRLVARDELVQRFPEPQAPPDHRWLPYAKPESGRSTELIQMRDSWEFSGENLADASASSDNMGMPAVSFKIKRGGEDIFADLTGTNVDRRLAIIMDEKIISAPVIRSQIRGDGQITGEFSVVEQERLVTVLKSGSFPVDLQFESINRIGPGIGSDSIVKGMRAIIIASVAVLLFIAIYYMGVGLVANFAILFNLAIILGFMTIFGATMTLPGIAGILLTVGMAVDANILIFERIREEKAKGKTIAQSVKNGYERAFVTILDANVTTLFTAGILYLVGTGAIKGFAVTLSIGILASMFTALFMTRAVFDFLVDAKAVTQFRMLTILSSPRYGFIRRAPMAVLGSILLIGVGMLLFAYRGDKNLGIDFLEGTLIDFNLTKPLPIEEVRKRITAYQGDGAIGQPVKPYAKAEVQEMWDYGEADEGKGAIHFEVRISQVGELTDPKDPKMTRNVSAVLEDDIRKLFATELVPAPFSDASVVADTYKVTFDFDLKNEKNLSKVTNVADVNRTLFAGKIATREARAFSKTFRFESDFVKIHPVAARSQAEIQVRIQAFKLVLQEEFDIDGEFPKNLRTELYGDIGLTVNLGRQVDAATIKDILKPFQEVSIAPDSGESASFRLSATRFKSLVGENPFNKRIHGWKELLREKLKEKDIQLAEPIPRTMTIGPVIAGELTERGTWAIILSLIVIILYIAFRFHLSGTSPYAGKSGLGSFIKDLFYKARFGFAAITAVVHDVLITLGAIAIFSELGLVDVKVDLQILAAFLTIIGYSLNDTIVVFDRIRENVTLSLGKKGFTDIVNESINQTLSRTLLTSVTTFVVVMTLFIFGGRIIRGFSFALMVGIVVGTYSSIFVASPVLVFWESLARAVKPEGGGKAAAKTS